MVTVYSFAILQKILTLILSSLAIRQAVLWNGQRWINTFAHTSTLLLLPIITFSITSVISGNIALSLGMVGALSIIRFRNPVKSPFELSIYFLMITTGITASVDIKWLIFLTLTAVTILILIEVFNKLSLFFDKKPLLDTSFSEGNSLNILEITLKEKNSDFLDSPYLINYIQNENLYIYRLAHNEKTILLDKVREIEKNNIITENIRFTIA